MVSMTEMNKNKGIASIITTNMTQKKILGAFKIVNGRATGQNKIQTVPINMGMVIEPIKKPAMVKNF